MDTLLTPAEPIPGSGYALVDSLKGFAERQRTSCERAAIAQLVRAARQAWPGTEAELWWRWMVEAGRSMQVPLRAIDCTLRDAWELCESGQRLATYLDRDGGILLELDRVRGDRCRVREVTAGGVTSRELSLHQIQEVLETTRLQDNRRWIVADRYNEFFPALELDAARARIGQATHAQGHHDGHAAHAAGGGHYGGHHGGGGHDAHGAGHAAHPTPFRRLMQMLGPEMSDVFVLIILALFVNFLVVATPIAGQELVRTVTFGTLYQPIVILSIMLLCFLSFMACLQALQLFVAEILQRRLFARLVADLAHRLPRVRYSTFRNHYGPELLNRFFEVVTVQKVTAGLLVDGLAVLLSTSVGMTILAFYHPYLLGYDLILLTVMVFIVMGLGRGGVSTAIRESICKFRVGEWLQELAHSPLAFRLHGASDFAAEHADQLVADYLQARRLHFRVLIRQFACILGLQAVAMTVLLGMGGYLVIQEQLTLGQLVGAELIIAMIVGSFVKLTKHIESFFDLMASLDKIGHLTDLPIEPAVGLMNMPSRGPMAVSAHQLVLVPHHSAQGEANHSHYDEDDDSDHSAPRGPRSAMAEREQHSIAALNFVIPSGSRVAITGPSGVGKSLLLEQLFGLRGSNGGYLLLDGLDPREIRPDILRKHVAMVRDPEVIPGTVLENVHLQRHDATPEAIHDALELVGLLEEIRHLPNGLQTVLTSQGFPLTESQIGRLVLARAIAGRPRLLLIDTLLDGLSDQDVDRLLRRLSADDQPWTLIVATGDQRVISGCQHVLDLSTGIAAPVEPPPVRRLSVQSANS